MNPKTCLIFVLLLRLVLPATAAPGDVDPLFGTAGTSQIDVRPYSPPPFNSTTNYDDYGRDAVVLSDGKILVAGYSEHTGQVPLNESFWLMRLLPDGTVDTTFGTAGRVVIYSAKAYAVAVQADGKIVVAGTVKTGGSGSNLWDVIVARYSSAGAPDTSFGTSGQVKTDFGSATIAGLGTNDAANDVAIQSDGKIVVGGSFVDASGNYFVAAARYSSLGAPDASFGTNGKLMSESLNVRGGARSINVQSDGKIVLAGDRRANANTFVEGGQVVRLTTAGVPDTTFSGDGKVTTSDSFNSTFTAPPPRM